MGLQFSLQHAVNIAWFLLQEDGQLPGSPPKASIKRLGKSLFGSSGLGSGAHIHYHHDQNHTSQAGSALLYMPAGRCFSI